MFVRFAAAKAVVRPDFSQLQPNYAISATNGYLTGGTCANSIPGGLQANCVYQYTANAGNPDLKPTRSTQYDLAYEWYFASDRQCDGDGVLQGHLQLHHQRRAEPTFTNNGVTRTVQVVQPYNAGHGTIKGFEVAYQQYYDFLPGLMKGFGAQANFTYVDSKGARNAASNPYDTTRSATSAPMATSCRSRACRRRATTSRPCTTWARSRPVWPTTGVSATC
jgi:TonB-dependent receptor